MKMNKKVYLIGGIYSYGEYLRWITPLGFEVTNKLEESDLCVGAGGEDWCPSYYKENKHPQTYTNQARNKYEWEMFQKAHKLNIPLVGICRSAQGGCVFSGGKLIQHMKHPGRHFVKTYDNKTIEVSSSHHQNQFPFNLPKEDYLNIAWAENLSPYHEGGNQEEMNPPVEPDIVYYRKTNFLCIQNHPEYMSLNHESVKYCQGLVMKLMDKEL